MCAKKSPAAEPGLYAMQDVGQVRLGDGVIHEAALLFRREESAPLHEAEVLGRHVAGDFARLGQFADGVLTLEQHLYHAQAMRVCQNPQTLGGLSEGLEAGQLEFGFRGHGWLTSTVKYIVTLRHVNTTGWRNAPNRTRGASTAAK
jgi:hypothetical protein